MDMDFVNNTTDNDFDILISENPLGVTGNKLLANIFEITFLTNSSDAVLSNGYGGNGLNIIGNNYNSNDTQSTSALIKIALDNTVRSMREDQDETLSPATELIESAEIISIIQDGDKVDVSIKIIPVEYESASFDNLNVVIPL